MSEQNTPNILLVRIDGRLVHGQVGVTWTNTLGANLVIVANDEVSTDEVQQNLMEMVLPETTQARFWTIDKTNEVIFKAAPRQKILVVVKTPQDALRLVEGGFPTKSINIGNIHFAEGKQQLTNVISVDKSDVDAFEKIHAMGIELEVRGVPSDHKQDLMDILKKAKF